MILTTNQLAVLNHVTPDGQAWADRTAADPNQGEPAVLAKVATHQASYDAAVAAQGINYKTLAELDLIDNPALTLAQAKTNAISKHRKEAKRRIKLLYDSDPTKFEHKKDNLIAESLALLVKKIDGTLDSADNARIVVIEQIKTDREAIQAAENTAATSINLEATDTIAKANAISPNWPS